MKPLNKMRLNAGLPMDLAIEITEKVEEKQITEAREAPRMSRDLAATDKRSLGSKVRGVERAMDHIRQAIAVLEKIPATDYSGEIPHFISELEDLIDGDTRSGMSGYLDNISGERDEFGKEPEPEPEAEMDSAAIDDDEIDFDVEISDDPEMTAVDDVELPPEEDDVMPEADDLMKNLTPKQQQQLAAAIATLSILTNGSMIKETMKRVSKITGKTLKEAAHYYNVNYDNWEKSDRPVNVSNGSSNDEQYTDEELFKTKSEAPEQLRTMDQQDNSPQDKSGDDLSNTIKIPKYVTKGLKDAIAEFRKAEDAESKRNKGFAKDAQWLYRDSANAFEELLELLNGSLYDFKLAQVKASTLMGPMLHKIPTKVWKFITNGGENQSLKSYMSEVPKKFQYPNVGTNKGTDKK